MEQIPTSVVGSITRPIWLIEARRAYDRGELGKEELDKLADLAVELTVGEMERTGVDQISDGEQRRTNFFEYLTEAVAGFAPRKVALKFSTETYFEPAVVGKISWDEPIGVKEFKFTKKLTRKPIKVPQAPITRLLRFYPEEGVPGYSRDAFKEDLIRLLRSEYRALLDAGAAAVQLDWPDITPLSTMDNRQEASRKISEMVQLVNETVGGLPSERLQVHVCFGNHKATHRVTGGSFKNLIPELYELRVSGYLLELANAQHEDDVEIFKEYSPPKGKRIYAGVIDVKTPDVEPVWLVRKRLERLVKYIDQSSLGATTDCGFAPGWYSYVIPRVSNFLKLKAMVDGVRDFAGQ